MPALPVWQYSCHHSRVRDRAPWQDRSGPNPLAGDAMQVIPVPAPIRRGSTTFLAFLQQFLSGSTCAGESWTRRTLGVRSNSISQEGGRAQRQLSA